MRPRVLLADDHTLLLGAFRKLLEPECEVVGAVENGRALLDSARELRPDVVVVDISMPLLNGLDAGRQLKQMLPGARLIFLTMDEDPDLVAEALRIGASGYLLKNSAASELVLAIREAMDGKTYVTPRAAERMGHARLGDGLTPRQREVLLDGRAGVQDERRSGAIRRAPQDRVRLGFPTAAPVSFDRGVATFFERLSVLTVPGAASSI